MKTQRVTVIDGPVPPEILERNKLEPHPVTAPEHQEVMRELMQREPLFHRPEFGSTRKDFEKMTAPEFWEVGASGCSGATKKPLKRFGPDSKARIHPAKAGSWSLALTR